MTGSKLLALATLACGFACAATSAQAAETGGYVGVMGGMTSSDFKKSDIDTAINGFPISGVPFVRGGPSTFDDSSNTWSFVWGYRFSPYVALEASYLSLGTFKYGTWGTIKLPAVPTQTAIVNGEFSAKGPSISALGIYPVTAAIDVYGRVGLLFTSSKFDVKTTANPGLTTAEINTVDFTATSRDMYYGAGAAYHWGTNWTFRLDYQHFVNVGDPQVTGEANADTITIGVMFQN